MTTHTVTTETVDQLKQVAAFCVRQSRALKDADAFTRHYLGKAEGIVLAIAAITGEGESALEVEVGRLAEQL